MRKEEKNVADGNRKENGRVEGKGELRKKRRYVAKWEG